MAMPYDATVIRCKLDELRVLDRAHCEAIEAAWPKTLEYLEAADDFKPYGTTTMETNRRLLEAELDEAIATAVRMP